MKFSDINPAAAAVLDKYIQLRQRVDARCELLYQLHGEHLSCARRCCECCRNLSVFPVEFYAIAWQLREFAAEDLPALDAEASCAFLENKLCSIYPCRPLICRTHGLAVVMHDGYGAEFPADVSHCKLNYASFDRGSFNAENTLDIFALNCELFALNGEFVALLEGEDFDISQRMDLIDVIEALRDCRD